MLVNSIPPETAWLADIAAACKHIGDYLHGVDKPNFLSNSEKCYAVFAQLIIVGDPSPGPQLVWKGTDKRSRDPFDLPIMIYTASGPPEHCSPVLQATFGRFKLRKTTPLLLD